MSRRDAARFVLMLAEMAEGRLCPTPLFWATLDALVGHTLPYGRLRKRLA